MQIPDFVPVVIRIMIVAGLIWSPFAAVITAGVAYLTRQAREETATSSIWGYALAGAIYSMLLIFPWIYMLSRMLGKPFPGFVVRIAYGMLYLILFSISTGFAVLLIIAASIDWDKSRVFYFEVTYYALVGFAATYALAISISTLLRKHSLHKKVSPVAQSPLIDSVYLEPFVWGITVFAGVLFAMLFAIILFIYVAYRPMIYGYTILSFLVFAMVAGVGLHQIYRRRGGHG